MRRASLMNEYSLMKELLKAKQKEEEDEENNDDETAKNTHLNEELGLAKEKYDIYTDSDSDMSEPEDQ
jgi:hypothetical protein